LWGQGLATKARLFAGVLVGMDCHYLNNPCPASFPYNRMLIGMRYARNRSELLPAKLRQLRVYLNISERNLSKQIVADIKSHSKRRIRIKPSYIAKFERGKREPDLVILLGYSRKAKVSIDAFVDDAITVDAFFEQLQKAMPRKSSGRAHKE
jgi:transcriptional regulator with XRE-family HTH domain